MHTQRPPLSETEKAWIKYAYEDLKMTQAEIAKCLLVSQPTIYKVLKKPVKKRVVMPPLKRYDLWKPKTIEAIAEMYYEGTSLRQLAKMFKCSPTTVYNILNSIPGFKFNNTRYGGINYHDTVLDDYRHNRPIDINKLKI
jgi:transposase